MVYFNNKISPASAIITKMTQSSEALVDIIMDTLELPESHAVEEMKRRCRSLRVNENVDNRLYEKIHRLFQKRSIDKQPCFEFNGPLLDMVGATIEEFDRSYEGNPNRRLPKALPAEFFRRGMIVQPIAKYRFTGEPDHGVVSREITVYIPDVNILKDAEDLDQLPRIHHCYYNNLSNHRRLGYYRLVMTYENGSVLTFYGTLFIVIGTEHLIWISHVVGSDTELARLYRNEVIYDMDMDINDIHEKRYRGMDDLVGAKFIGDVITNWYVNQGTVLIGEIRKKIIDGGFMEVIDDDFRDLSPLESMENIDSHISMILTADGRRKLAESVTDEEIENVRNLFENVTRPKAAPKVDDWSKTEYDHSNKSKKRIKAQKRNKKK